MGLYLKFMGLYKINLTLQEKKYIQELREREKEYRLKTNEELNKTIGNIFSYVTNGIE